MVQASFLEIILMKWMVRCMKGSIVAKKKSDRVGDLTIKAVMQDLKGHSTDFTQQIQFAHHEHHSAVLEKVPVGLKSYCVC